MVSKYGHDSYTSPKYSGNNSTSTTTVKLVIILWISDLHPIVKLDLLIELSMKRDKWTQRKYWETQKVPLF